MRYSRHHYAREMGGIARMDAVMDGECAGSNGVFLSSARRNNAITGEQIADDLSETVRTLREQLDHLSQAGLEAVAAPLMTSLDDIELLASAAAERSRTGDTLYEELDAAVKAHRELRLEHSQELLQREVAHAEAEQGLQRSLKNVSRMVDSLRIVLTDEVRAGRLKRGAVDRIFAHAAKRAG